MDDDALNRFRPLDPGRINTMDELERRWWCRELGCTDEQLQRAVTAAGEHVAAVRAELARHR